MEEHQAALHEYMVQQAKMRDAKVETTQEREEKDDLFVKVRPAKNSYEYVRWYNGPTLVPVVHA